MANYYLRIVTGSNKWEYALSVLMAKSRLRVLMELSAVIPENSMYLALWIH
jgi:hypothetical protein